MTPLLYIGGTLGYNYAIDNKILEYCRELFLGIPIPLALGLESKGSIAPSEVVIFH